LIHFIRNILPENIKKILRYYFEFDFIFKNFLNKTRDRNIFLSDFVFRKKNFLNNQLIKQHKNILNSLLYYSDIVSMKHSIECRSPFLDHRLVDYVFSTDEKTKINKGENKYLLRLIDEYLIFDLNKNRNKVGFHSPISKEIKSNIISEINKSKIFELKIFNKKNKKKLISRLKIKNNDFFLFRIYQLNLWLKIFKKNIIL